MTNTDTGNGTDAPAARIPRTTSRLADVAAQPTLLDADRIAMSPNAAAGPTLSGDEPLSEAVATWTAKLAVTRPSRHTLAAYTRDLARFATVTGNRRLFAYVQDDVAHFLAEAGTLATRKRRLTSLRRFWAFVIADIDLPLKDPTIGFVAPPIDL